MRTYKEYSIDRLNNFKEQALIYKSTSDKYRTVDSQDLINTTERVLNEHGLEYSRSIGGTVRGFKGTKHVIKYTIENNELTIKGDKLKPTINFLNSYNGESALMIRVGFFRLICSNGLIVGQSFYSDRLVHVKGMTIEAKLSALAIKLNDAICFIKNQAVDKLEQAFNKDLTKDQELTVLNNLKNDKVISNRIYDKAVMLRTQGIEHGFIRSEDSSRNTWTLYNTINEVIRTYSRSELSNTVKNIKLMDTVIEYAKAA